MVKFMDEKKKEKDSGLKFENPDFAFAFASSGETKRRLHLDKDDGVGDVIDYVSKKAPDALLILERKQDGMLLVVPGKKKLTGEGRTELIDHVEKWLTRELGKSEREQNKWGKDGGGKGMAFLPANPIDDEKGKELVEAITKFIDEGTSAAPGTKETRTRTRTQRDLSGETPEYEAEYRRCEEARKKRKRA